MKQQREVIVGPHTFQVPARIQRCPGGWQVRYLGTNWFADGAEGPGRSLTAARAELRTRMP